MAGQPLQRDLPGILRLGRVLEIEDMTPTFNHHQGDFTAQRGQTRREAPGLCHRRGAILVAVEQQHGGLHALRLIQRGGLL
jgi:hypothetical protein